MRSTPGTLLDIAGSPTASPINTARTDGAVLPFDRGRGPLRRPVYHFGDFVLVTELYEVRARDEPVAIAPKVFDFLLCLIENRDRVMTHADLRSAVWPGVAITDASLTYAVMAARRALGDTGSTQTIIRNVRGRGYRFVAALKDIDGGLLDDPRLR